MATQDKLEQQIGELVSSLVVECDNKDGEIDSLTTQVKELENKIDILEQQVNDLENDIDELTRLNGNA